jgi:nucleoside-diphosphate-sugar epimerase
MGIWGAYLLESLYGLINAAPPIKVNNIKSITSGRRLSIQKAQKDLDFIPRVGLEEGVRKTMEWYKKEGLL